ncbi:MAG: DsrE family protein [Nitrospirae bacterium]|nr:DsrE family protein [Nitrospirota bacterium]
MSTGLFKKMAIIIRSTPFNTIALTEAFRMGIGMTLADNKVKILLIGDGVWSSLNLSPQMIGRPDLFESIELLSACGVRVLADETSMDDRNISVHECHVEKVSRDEIYKVISESDAVVSFG